MGPTFDFKDNLGDACIAQLCSCKTEGGERGMKADDVGLMNQSPSTLLQLILTHRNTAITQGIEIQKSHGPRAHQMVERFRWNHRHRT